MDFSSLNPETTNALNLAARQNDIPATRRLLKKINPNCIDNRGWTCLHEAAANDSFESLMLILSHRRCRPLAETHEGHTALYLACRYHCSRVTITALLYSDVDIVNYTSTERVTPLHVVSAQGRIEIMQLLIDYGAFIDVQDFDGDTPLHDAVLEKQYEAVNMLLHAGADPNITNDKHYTPFHLACLKGCHKTLEYLLPFVDNINKVAKNGDTPLMIATQGRNIEVVDFLLNHGADPHLRNLDGDLALDLALTMGLGEIFLKLLNVTNKNEINLDLVISACKPHHFRMDIIKNIIDYDLGSDFFYYYGSCELHIEEIGAVKPVYVTCTPLKPFLDICEYTFVNSQSLFWSVFYGFLMHGVDVNPIHSDECSPLFYLHYVTHETCFKSVFETLINHGCDVDTCTTTAQGNQCIPDVFIASLSADPTTLPLMVPYSLQVEPENLLLFAHKNDVLGRIPQDVQRSLLLMIDNNAEEFEVESLRFYVPTLKHLVRLKIRSLLKHGNVKTTQQFLDVLKRLYLPEIVKSYLRYL